MRVVKTRKIEPSPLLENETRLFYDLTAVKTADEWYQNDILMPTAREFVSLLPGEPRVLDLGCGPGHEAKRLASLGANVVGIDYSSECIHVAEERCPGCKFEAMDFRDLDDRFGRFDGVFASGSLIHLNRDELPDVIGRISSILKDGGYCLMIIQDGEGINEKYSRLEVDGRVLSRPVYCYRKDYLTGIAVNSNLGFIKEGFLDKSLFEYNWKNYIFKRNKGK
ncbi:MAG: class I SAM-dependent methyltransferase [Candidatus Omnitrophota bacterium]